MRVTGFSEASLLSACGIAKAVGHVRTGTSNRLSQRPDPRPEKAG